MGQASIVIAVKAVLFVWLGYRQGIRRLVVVAYEFGNACMSQASFVILGKLLVDGTGGILLETELSGDFCVPGSIM